MKRLGLLAALLLTSGCESPEVISNELMQEMYPDTFRSGDPPYLERDFEAGADFICDEVKTETGRDLCSEPNINWRRPQSSTGES